MSKLSKGERQVNKHILLMPCPLCESQPLFSKKAQYREIDAALGVVEKGRNHNDDTYIAQPWLPDSLVPHVITWTREGYVPVGDPYAGTSGRAPKSNTASTVDT